MTEQLNNQLIERLMAEALQEARRAALQDEVPVGAVLYVDGQIVARGHNQVEKDCDASAHAEVLVLRRAAQTLANWRLRNATLCVTLEPCTMCIGAIRLFRIQTVIFGCRDPRLGAIGSLYDLSQDERLGEIPRVIAGVCQQEAQELLKSFFKQRRAVP